MDILENCNSLIERELEKLDSVIGNQNGAQDGLFQQTQTAIEAVIAERDKNLDRLLDQQSHLKAIIDKDSRIKSLKDGIISCRAAIDELRKNCSEFDVNAIRSRQELLDAQAKEIDRFQMQQLRSIAEDQRRHQGLLEHRRREIAQIKKEIENEEKGREAYLADVEKNLNKQLQDRQELSRGSGFPISSAGGPNDESVHRDNIELESINEYAPYGPTSTSRPTQPRSRRGGAARGGPGRGRGRRGRGK